jgi:Integrase core domain
LPSRSIAMTARLSWVATTAGISGEMIRDMMVRSVEQRFGAICAPHPVQWLSDNGSIFAAHRTIEIALALNLVPCFTPVESPESNGMAEAFVKTFKRDYVRVSPIPDAAAALGLIDSWMEDYNTVHPQFPIGLPITPRIHSVPTRRVSGLMGATPMSEFGPPRDLGGYHVASATERFRVAVQGLQLRRHWGGGDSLSDEAPRLTAEILGDAVTESDEVHVFGTAAQSNKFFCRLKLDTDAAEGWDLSKRVDLLTRRHWILSNRALDLSRMNYSITRLLLPICFSIKDLRLNANYLCPCSKLCPPVCKPGWWMKSTSASNGRSLLRKTSSLGASLKVDSS